MNTKFSILGVGLEYDFTDADSVEKLENALQEAKDAFNTMELPQGGAASIREACKPYHKLFADVFGEDVKDQIFRGKSNYGDCMAATQELINAELAGKKQLETAMANMGNHVNNPKPMNRKQRRAQMRNYANNSAK